MDKDNFAFGFGLFCGGMIAEIVLLLLYAFTPMSWAAMAWLHVFVLIGLVPGCAFMGSYVGKVIANEFIQPLRKAP